MSGGHSLNLFFFITLLGFFYALIPSIVKLLLTFFGAANKDELDLMSQVTELKKQMSRINMVDEFAAYARLQRQSNKLRDQIKSRGADKNMYLLKLKYGSTIVLYMIYALVSCYTLWYYRSAPLLILPKTMFQPFYPVGFILAFPSGIQGAIGVTPWLAISIFTGRKLCQALYL